ncbi:Inositol-1-monophosphatase [hydrothermal vent metagenome]|uniref:inositol-phosphate phosphatase n=1 Tax=hydrothermal vent metagenome TaxID=652676 RepID=A0A1W1CCK9_9ZZZZ
MKSIEILKRVAKDAGDIVYRGYHESKTITHKGVVDLVTQYDVATEKYILGELSREFPDHILVGEESHKGSYDFEKAIYIDPIDGTTNFIHGIPHLAISIAVWEGGLPVMAVVYNPILDEMFYATKDQGAYCNEKKLTVSTQDKLQQSLIATGFPYAKVDRGVEYHWVIESMTNLLPYIRDIRRLGAAAIDLCYLAEGRTDGFYEIDLKPWDVAGGILILLEAGGEVTNTKGDIYTFIDRGIIATNGKIHQELSSYLSSI